MQKSRKDKSCCLTSIKLHTTIASLLVDIKKVDVRISRNFLYYTPIQLLLSLIILLLQEFLQICVSKTLYYKTRELINMTV